MIKEATQEEKRVAITTLELMVEDLGRLDDLIYMNVQVKNRRVEWLKQLYHIMDEIEELGIDLAGEFGLLEE
jgi:hypothetical protein